MGQKGNWTWDSNNHMEPSLFPDNSYDRAPLEHFQRRRKARGRVILTPGNQI